jgi:DNA adenine methylase
VTVKPTLPHPFLRWAGAKRAYISNLSRYVPADFSTYYEPFLGAGSLLLSLAPEKAVVSDIIAPLIETFRSVRDEPRKVHAAISKWPVDKPSYYEVRSLEPKNSAQKAAKFIYLNKTCWNGLYRVNRSGQFNVPFGRPKSSHVAALENLEACSRLLNSDISIAVADFEATLSEAVAGDFAFLDPPYITDASKGFVEYNETLFTWSDQCRLARMAKELDKKDVKFVMTNADHQSVRELYADFEIRSFQRMSTIASSSAHRRQVSELIITNQQNISDE